MKRREVGVGRITACHSHCREGKWSLLSASTSTTPRNLLLIPFVISSWTTNYTLSNSNLYDERCVAIKVSLDPKLNSQCTGGCSTFVFLLTFHSPWNTPCRDIGKSLLLHGISFHWNFHCENPPLKISHIHWYFGHKSVHFKAPHILGR